MLGDYWKYLKEKSQDGEAVLLPLGHRCADILELRLEVDQVHLQGEGGAVHGVLRAPGGGVSPVKVNLSEPAQAMSVKPVDCFLCVAIAIERKAFEGREQFWTGPVAVTQSTTRDAGSQGLSGEHGQYHVVMMVLTLTRGTRTRVWQSGRC